MKLHPISSALFSAATDSSSRCVPQLPPIAQAPNPISETFQPSRPNVLYFMARILIHLDCDRNSQDFVDPPAGPEILAGSEGFVTRHLISLLPIIALSSLTLAAGVTFSGVDQSSGPPFPTAPITLDVIGAAGDPIQTLLVSIPSASPGAGLGFHAFGSDTLGKFDA